MTRDTESSNGTAPAPAADFHEDARPPARSSDNGNRSALVVAAVALAAALTAPYWTPPLYRALHLRPPGLEWQARQDVETARLTQSLAELDRRFAVLGDMVAKANDQAAGAKAAQATVETQFRVLALLQLRAVMRRPVPFDAELKAVRAFGGKIDALEPLLAVIEPYASIGIPLELQLRREFTAVADMLAYAEVRPSMVHWLANFAGWPKEPAPPEGEARPERPSSIAAQAQARLAENDLRGAIEALAALEGDAAAAARSWLGQTQARLAANEAADRIAEYVATALSGVSSRM